MGELVYHYCSFATFKKILENPKLRFTDITKSDDRYEISYLWNSIVNYIGQKTKSELNKKIFEYEIKNQYKVSTHLVTCFSEDSDSLLLWKMYADGGVSLGFDKDYLCKLSKKILILNNQVIISEDNDNGCVCKFGEVNYIAQYDIKKYLEENFSNIGWGLESFGDFFACAPFTKTSFWKEEKEWRLVISLIRNDAEIKDYNQIVNICNVKNIDMCLEKNRGFETVLSCYVPFDKNAIKSIVIAPNNNIEEKEVCFLLEKNGFNINEVEIKKSLGSLR